MYADDTIAAIATPVGQGGVGIVRVSGALSGEIAAAVFCRSHTTQPWQSHRMYHGSIRGDGNIVLDIGLAVLMFAPHSFTGEDVLELHCHGSPVVLRAVLARVLRCGARPAEPGEFTKRAFLNGRLDLAQAEAVVEMVRSRTPGGAALAAQQLSGSLSRRLDGLRTELIRLKALLEAQIDFAEEELEVSRVELLCLAQRGAAAITALVDTFRHGKLMRDGLRVVIAGKPNVGKSSLLNALLGEERAIVTAIAGTTRDTIEEVADFAGVPVALVDTAGVRRDEGVDPVERIGMERTMERLNDAHVVLAVMDAAQPLDRDDHAVLQRVAGSRHLIVLNKVDLPLRLGDDDFRGLVNGQRIVRVSAKERLGLEELRQSVLLEIDNRGAASDDGVVVTNLRHVDGLRKADASLRLAIESIMAARAPELIAVDVQDAIDHLAQVTGAITNEDVLDRIFSEFCIGK